MKHLSLFEYYDDQNDDNPPLSPEELRALAGDVGKHPFFSKAELQKSVAGRDEHLPVADRLREVLVGFIPMVAKFTTNYSTRHDKHGTGKRGNVESLVLGEPHKEMIRGDVYVTDMRIWAEFNTRTKTYSLAFNPGFIGTPDEPVEEEDEFLDRLVYEQNHIAPEDLEIAAGHIALRVDALVHFCKKHYQFVPYSGRKMSLEE